MPDFEIQVNKTSLLNLKNNLDELKRAMKDRIAKKAIYHAASKVSEAAREQIRQEDLIYTGNLERSIGVAGNKDVKDGQVGVKVGIIKWDGDRAVKLYKGDAGLEGVDRDAFYGRFLELGTKTITPRHWLQRAAASSAQTFVGEFVVKAGELFENEKAKLHK